MPPKAVALRNVYRLRLSITSPGSFFMRFVNQ